MDTRRILFRDGNLFLVQDDEGLRLPTESDVDFAPCGETFSLASGVTACAVTDARCAAGESVWMELRASYGRLAASDFALAVKGSELVHWDATSRYCSVCGAATVRAGEIMKRCGGCGREIFPQLSPAAIVLVRRGREALLVHARTFRRPFFGLVAGFVETGESLEECVVREVREETGLEICNVRYFGSQSWPFPAQLMVGFTADWKAGDVVFADGELTEGGFFSPENVPLIPTRPSIARSMIECWLEECGMAAGEAISS